MTKTSVFAQTFKRRYSTEGIKLRPNPTGVDLGVYT